MKLFVFFLFLVLFSSNCSANDSCKLLGQKPLSQKIKEFGRNMNKFFEGESIDEKFKRWYESALSRFSNKQEAQVVTADDGFVYVRTRGNVLASKFNEKKDLLRVTPSDWKSCDYRKGKSVYTKHYYKHHFAQNEQSRTGRLGMDVYGYSRKAIHLGEVDFSKKGARLKKILKAYDGAKHSSHECGEAVRNFIAGYIKQKDEQAALMSVEYEGTHQWLLAFKKEDCFIKQVRANDEELISAEAIYFADLDPHLGGGKVFRLFYIPSLGKYSFEHSYIKNHAKAYDSEDENLLQSKRYLNANMLCSYKMSPIRGAK